ncbi:putative metal-dependent phosphoesterase TrpH [Halohasta litchfieldiae]|uniref:Predicted metal-dependent phosphoesterase TrpH, contains PHP domain n=2 Tax=Halohasta litchfieldiae TaxID=1073996 RepID=A0A1H6T479_9EURY|nr:putative metal-dependent phosphoesterase TrpH [Halohasta litchfieldiae]SEI74939.1 Predicted metal-dependent phosphoesterase TrpH, contains PHP domain [Halohasta litchfieldiae]
MTGSQQTRVDMHVKILNDEVVSRAKRRGIDVLVYAPHFTRLPEIRRTAANYTDDDLLVVPARELFTGDWNNRRHLLAVGLSEPVADFITFEAAMAECDRQGAAVVVPHPSFMNVSLTWPEIRAHAARIDAIETYNAKLFPHQNRRGQRIAADLDIPGVGSSYAHLPSTVGEAWTLFETDSDSEDALVEALKTAAPRRVQHRSGIGHRARSGLEFSHLLYENTWEKVDRLLLSGDEPTHPRNLVYEGRFDDVSVY